jgi:hypothetical protein
MLPDVFAGASPPEGRSGEPAARPLVAARALHAATAAVAAADHARLGDAASTLRDALAPWPDFATEGEAALSAFEDGAAPGREATAREAARAAELPFGLHVLSPHGVAPLGDRLVALLEGGRAVRAEQAAEALRAPLRAVEDELQQLLGEGACVLERAGRGHAYRLTDGTEAREGVTPAPARPRRWRP